MGGSVLSLLVTLSKYLNKEMNQKSSEANLEFSHYTSLPVFYKLSILEKTRLSLRTE